MRAGLPLAAMLLFGAAAAAPATPPRPSIVEAPARAASTWGGRTDFSFDPDALAALGIVLERGEAALDWVEGQPGRRYARVAFAADTGDTADAAGGLQLLRSGARVTGLGGGERRHRGGPRLRLADGAIDLSGFALRALAGTRVGLELVDRDGTVWFTADHPHYGIDAGEPGRFSMRHMNLRVAPALAVRLGHPERAGFALGGLDWQAEVSRVVQPDAPGDLVCLSPWPAPGLRTDIEMIYSPQGVGSSGYADTVVARRCGREPLGSGAACTESSRDGWVVITPDSSLRNAGQTGVAWYSKFSGAHPPYGNAQHPYLVWNLYRIDADGGLRQLGASGVKHAFYSINWNCACAPANVIHPGCEDTYSIGSNDNSPNGAVQEYQALGPRREVVPYSARWASCGSVFDPQCRGAMEPGAGAANLFEYRLLVREREMLPPASLGARYFLEYWYLVRDDDDVDDSIAHRELWPRKNGAVWSVGLDAAGAAVADGNFRQGTVLARWIADAAAKGERTALRELATPTGRVRVGVRVLPLDGGRWRYEYAVMNLDYAQARIDPAHAGENDLRLLSNRGLRGFAVSLGRGVDAQALRFIDLDDDPANDWNVTIRGGAIEWSARGDLDTLDWGTLYTFAFITDQAPVERGSVRLTGAAEPDTEADALYRLELPGPAPDGSTTGRALCRPASHGC